MNLILFKNNRKIKNIINFTRIFMLFNDPFKPEMGNSTIFHLNSSQLIFNDAQVESSQVWLDLPISDSND
jgi:hypothetical protein